VKVKNICVWFNKPQGCLKGDECRFTHKKVSKEKLASVMKKLVRPRQHVPDPVMYVPEAGTRDKPYCYKCFAKDHLANVCPKKNEINEFIRSLSKTDGVPGTGGNGSAAVNMMNLNL
jgi:hypothetical protein